MNFVKLGKQSEVTLEWMSESTMMFKTTLNWLLDDRDICKLFDKDHEVARILSGMTCRS